MYVFSVCVCVYVRVCMHACVQCVCVCVCMHACVQCVHLCYSTLYLVRPEGSWGTEDTKGMVIFRMFGGLYLILKWSIRSLQFQKQKHTNPSDHRCINMAAIHVCKCVTVCMLLMDRQIDRPW